MGNHCCCTSKVDAKESEIRTGCTENLPKQQLQDIEEVVPQISQTYLAQTSHNDDNHEAYKDSYQASFQESPLSNNITILISETNYFIQQQVIRHIENKECVLNQNVVISSDRDLIILSGPIEEVKEANQIVLRVLELYRSRYIRRNKKSVVYLNEGVRINQDQQQIVKELSLLKIYYRNKKNIEKNENCRIIIKLQNDQQQQLELLKISYQNRELKILQGDIMKIRTEAVVNTSNQYLDVGNESMQTKVSRKVYQLGTGYKTTCDQYINSNSMLKYGDVLSYCLNMEYKYILTVSQPFYQQGSQTDHAMQITEQNIEAIFKEANRLNIREITFPIIGGGASGFCFSLATETVIGAVIERLYSMSTSVMTINIIEIDQVKVKTIVDVTKQIISQQPKRQIKYQWQWLDGEVYKDYDDKEINEQIDQAYEIFQYDNTKKEIQLIFAFNKQPGTHKVDLKKNTLTDKNFNTVQTITLGNHQGVSYYFFNNKPVHDVLNEFMFIQNRNGTQQFEIFYKRHKIVFSNQKIEQINEDTSYSRQVKHIPYTNLQFNKGCVLYNKQYQLSQDGLFNKSQLVTQSSLTVETRDINHFNRVSSEIHKSIAKNCEKMTLIIPPIDNNDLSILSQIIEDDALQIQGHISVASQVTIVVTPLNKQKILNHTQQAVARQQAINQQPKPQISQTFPKEWTNQQQNIIKVALSPNDMEYQKIQQSFMQTDKGKVHAIFRIQNIILWENYMLEKKKLIGFYKSKNEQLNAQELELYAWHGVRFTHPRIIYESEREGFNPEYSNDRCLWGPGCYFAQKAKYSREYSYTLQASDDAVHNGKKVFLYCLLTTGRLQTTSANNSLRRPPDGFDCVSGVAEDSTIYILYQMGARRAYPAYEVIYE